MQHSAAAEEARDRGKRLLEENSVRAVTSKRYFEVLDEFLEWTKLSTAERKEPTKLDIAIVEYLEHLYFEGYGSSAGSFLAAAIKHVDWIPDAKTLQRSHRALKGYARLTPSQSRGPLPLVGAAAMIMSAMAAGEF